jgi:hypothetical protein
MEFYRQSLVNVSKISKLIELKYNEKRHRKFSDGVFVIQKIIFLFQIQPLQSTNFLGIQF